MAEAPQIEPLATSLNGVVTPLYFDRQVVRAGDLTLDRSSHDAELARMRRLLHGWGIVAGFALSNPDEGVQGLTVTPGYGVTPNGHEIYLTQAVALPNLSEVLLCSCGTGMLGCEIVDGEARRLVEENPSYGWAYGWLVARPYQKDSDLRPGVPEGCDHPANALLPSRRCEGVAFDVVCSLHYPHVQESLSCEYLTEWMCRPAWEGREPLPLPAPVEACDDYLVLGFIIHYAGVLYHSYEYRRPLLPVSLLQDWVTSCMCGINAPQRVAGGPVPAPPVEPAAGPQLDVTFVPAAGPPIPPAGMPVPEKPSAGPLSWALLNARAVANGLPPVVIDGASLQKLLAAGIDAPGKLLSADLEAVAFSTGLAKSKLEVMRKNVEEKKFLLNAPQF